MSKFVPIYIGLSENKLYSKSMPMFGKVKTLLYTHAAEHFHFEYKGLKPNN
jgi:hypothetical protein